MRILFLISVQEQKMNIVITELIYVSSVIFFKKIKLNERFVRLIGKREVGRMMFRDPFSEESAKRKRQGIFNFI